MQKLFRRFVALAIGATLVAGSYVSTSLTAQRVSHEVTLVAPWAVPRYTNHNRQNSQTNLALRNAMVDFYLREAPYFYNPFPQNWIVPPLDANDLRVSADFAATFLRGFREDTFTRTLPLNDAYMEHLLNNVEFYFSTRRNRWYWNNGDYQFVRADYPYSGFYDHTRGAVFIAATREWSDIFGYRFVFYERFARTAIHEVAHVMGLGESLAHLVEEMYMGLDGPLRLGNWERDSSFDRALLAVAGPDAFWTAAFTSNAAYGNLWNTHFGHLIDFADLQMARGLALQMRRDGTLPQQYAEVPNLFFRAFEPDTPDDRRRLYVTQTQLAVSHLNDFIVAHNLHIEPIFSVFDFKIHSRR